MGITRRLRVARQSRGYFWTAKFASEQEEADTKMIYHLSLLDKDVEATVV